MGEDAEVERHHRIVIQIRVRLPSLRSSMRSISTNKYQNAAAGFVQVGVSCERQQVEWRNGLLYLIKNSSK